MNRKTLSRTSEKTRQAVIDAAIHCLATEGYHRATSNRIARAAGLSWGVIQYHFGDRAGIYRAVLDTIIDAYVLQLDQIAQRGKGKPVPERLALLADSLWELLNHPAYLATMELLMNLSRDPELALDTRLYVNRWAERMAILWQGIFPEFPEGHAGSAAARQIFFAALRGFVDNRLIGQWPSRSVPEGVLQALARACAVLLV
ncbi:MAG: TetR/AcrR family transcriptional regulator [Pseudomonadales bacterium]|jgi:AcrR family transcriptional regulator|nr:TetR/AcrR family transcriptional regulator [Cellvibrionales bacterium]MBP8030332.1 TetR/AcrR family transcriptional regulator [Pseudomonadales bacterium]